MYKFYWYHQYHIYPKKYIGHKVGFFFYFILIVTHTLNGNTKFSSVYAIIVIIHFNIVVSSIYIFLVLSKKMYLLYSWESTHNFYGVQYYPTYIFFYELTKQMMFCKKCLVSIFSNTQEKSLSSAWNFSKMNFVRYIF